MNRFSKQAWAFTMLFSATACLWCAGAGRAQAEPGAEAREPARVKESTNEAKSSQVSEPAVTLRTPEPGAVSLPDVAVPPRPESDPVPPVEPKAAAPVEPKPVVAAPKPAAAIVAMPKSATPQELFSMLPEGLSLPAGGAWDPIDTVKAMRWLGEHAAGVEMTASGVVRICRPKLSPSEAVWVIEMDSPLEVSGRLVQFRVEGHGEPPANWMAVPAGHRTTLHGKLRSVQLLGNYYAPTGALLFMLDPLEPGTDETLTLAPFHRVSDFFPELPPELRPDKDGTWVRDQMGNLGWILRYFVTGRKFESNVGVTTVLPPTQEGDKWSVWVQTKGEDHHTYVLLTFLGDEEMIRPLTKIPVGQWLHIEGVIYGINSNGIDHMPGGRDRFALNMVIHLDKWSTVK